MRNISMDASMARRHQALDGHLPQYFGTRATGNIDAALGERMVKSRIN